MDGQLFLREPSARGPVSCPRVAAACQRLCCAAVRAPLGALHRLRAFFCGVRWRHGCKSFITPNKLERESADERIRWVKHARVKHPLCNILSETGRPGSATLIADNGISCYYKPPALCLLWPRLLPAWTLSLLPPLVSCDQSGTARAHSAPTGPVWDVTQYWGVRGEKQQYI